MKNALHLLAVRRRRGDYSATSIAIIALLLTALGVLVTTFLTASAVNQHNSDMQTSRRQQSMSMANHIQDTMADYEQLLFAAVGAMKVTSDEPVVSRQIWQRLTINLQIQMRHPEVLGFGYAAYIQPDQLQQFTDAMRAEAFADFSVTPTTPRSEYTAIRYLEPYNDVNQHAIGYDMYSEPVRQQAMALARDTGATAISAPLVLKQDEAHAGTSTAPGIVMYYPVYSGRSTPPTTEARRQALRGYAYIAFRVQDMMQLADTTLTNGRYTLHDVTDTAATMYVREEGDVAGAEKQPDYSQNLAIFNRSWQSIIYIKDPSVNRLVNPLLTFSLGIVTSCLLGVGLYILLSRRLRLVQKTHQQELQRTKDELLALTSHQLRTPATGVKQYLGMLVNGYFGNLDADQSSVVHKAYAANERQLEIIDQLLYVAKADAGQILLVTEKLDVVSLAKEVVEGFASSANAKSIQLKLKAPAKLHCKGDPRYIRMIAENLISNAIKYSFPNTAIRITVSSRGNSIMLSVKDHGVGIGTADMAKLFQKFGRIDNPLSRSEGGSGLGLFLAQKLARAHHGSVQVRSRLGSGSTFTLVLPKQQPKSRNVAQLTD